MTHPDPVSPVPAADVPFRCSQASRDRDDPLVATAVPARRWLLVEVPGPWPRAPLARLGPGVATVLNDRALAAGARLVLIRRPGRRPENRTERAWAVADTHGAVRWGSFTDEADLMRVDPADEVVARGPQDVALVCTHGGRDVCCAMRGRPVAAALSTVAGLDTWECTHVGGDRFAANLVLLPSGEMFGRLDPVTAVEVVDRFRHGRLDLRHHRGRSGQPESEQAVRHLVADALGDDRHHAVAVIAVTAGHGQELVADVAHLDRRYRAVVELGASRPARLTCAAVGPSTARRYRLASLDAIDPVTAGPGTSAA